MDQDPGHHAVTRDAVHALFMLSKELGLADSHGLIRGMTEAEYFTRLDKAQAFQDRLVEHRVVPGPTTHPWWANPDAQKDHSLVYDPSRTGLENLSAVRDRIVEKMVASLALGPDHPEFSPLGAAMHDLQDSYSSGHTWRADSVYRGDYKAPIQSMNCFDPTSLIHSPRITRGYPNWEGTHDPRFDKVAVDKDGHVISGSAVAASRATLIALIHVEYALKEQLAGAQSAWQFGAPALKYFHDCVNSLLPAAPSGVHVNRKDDVYWRYERDHRLNLEKSSVGKVHVAPTDVLPPNYQPGPQPDYTPPVHVPPPASGTGGSEGGSGQSQPSNPGPPNSGPSPPQPDYQPGPQPDYTPGPVYVPPPAAGTGGSEGGSGQSQPSNSGPTDSGPAAPQPNYQPGPQRDYTPGPVYVPLSASSSDEGPVGSLSSPASMSYSYTSPDGTAQHVGASDLHPDLATPPDANYTAPDGTAQHIGASDQHPDVQSVDLGQLPGLDSGRIESQVELHPAVLQGLDFGQVQSPVEFDPGAPSTLEFGQVQSPVEFDPGLSVDVGLLHNLDDLDSGHPFDPATGDGSDSDYGYVLDDGSGAGADGGSGGGSGAGGDGGSGNGSGAGAAG